MSYRLHFTPPKMTNIARRLRRDSTTPERILWGLLRAGKIAGMKFRRQHVVGPFVVDYYCHESKLVVELDGMSHVGQAESDDQRTHYLESQGLRVVRFTNDDVLSDPTLVAEAIARAAGVSL